MTSPWWRQFDNDEEVPYSAETYDLLATIVRVGDTVAYGLDWMEVAAIDTGTKGRTFRGNVYRRGVPAPVRLECENETYVKTRPTAVSRKREVIADLLRFPMPNDRIALATPNANVPRTAADEVERIVVASCYTSDDECLLLLLNPEPPYFTVAEVELSPRRCVCATAFENINQAVDHYAQSGGDN